MKKKILIIGQVPPPYLGQAIMTERVVNLKGKDFEIHYINSSFSKKSSQFGRLNFSKILTLLRISYMIIYHRFYTRCNYIYYSPSGHRVPAIMRDILLLCWSRKLFDNTIFHFHAYGLNIVYKKLNRFNKLLFRLSFMKPDHMIKITKFVSKDQLLIKPKKTYVIPNGSQDFFNHYEFNKKNELGNTFNMLYVGAIYQERGIDDIIEMSKYIAKVHRVDIHITFVGEFVDQNYKKDILKRIQEYELDNLFTFKGELIGKEKFIAFNNTDLLLFPSYVPSETFGLVIIEAMQFYKPSIITNHNGPKHVIEKDIDSTSYTPGNVKELIKEIINLIENKDFYYKLSENARRSYESKYTIKIFERNFIKFFENL